MLNKEITEETSMKKIALPIALCWALIGLIFFTFTVLATVQREGATLVRAFYALFLCHPFFRTVQFYSNRQKFSETSLPPYSEYQKKHMVFEYFVGKGVYILIGVAVMFLALGNAFGHIMIYDYLAVVLYAAALVLLEVGISNRS